MGGGGVEDQYNKLITLVEGQDELNFSLHEKELLWLLK